MADETTQRIVKGFIDPLGVTFPGYAAAKIPGGAAARENKYTPQVAQALGGFRERPSAAGVLGGLNMGKVARAGHVAMRGGSPLSQAVTLSQTAPTFTRVGQGVGRAQAAEQDFINGIYRGAFGEEARQALARAASEAERRDIIMDVERGIAEKRQIDSLKSASEMMAFAGKGIGAYREAGPMQKPTPPGPPVA